MAYDHIQSAAVVPDPDAGPFIAEYNALRFAREWREYVLTLIKATAKHPERIKYISIKRLNAAIAALVPDIVSVATRATVNDELPWLYSTNELPQEVSDSLLKAWLMDLQPKPSARHEVREAWRGLCEHQLAWEPTAVDLLEFTTSAGATAIPPPHLYRLLTDVLAARIEQACLGDEPQPYEFNGQQVFFRRVTSNVFAGSAELMSWPPLEHTTKTKAGKETTWYYSATIVLSLRTEPFSAVPRVHISTGIRRWLASSQVFFPPGRTVGVYLSSRTPLIVGAPAPERFAFAKLRRTGEGVSWVGGGPTGIMGRLSVTRDFPSPELLRENPDKWLHGTDDGVTAAVVYHTMMGGRHAIGAGLMPAERRRLTEWAMSKLTPYFKPIEGYRRTKLPAKQQIPFRVLEPKDSIKKELKPKKISPDTTPEEQREIEEYNEGLPARNAKIVDGNEKIAAKNLETMARNAERRRALLSAVVGERGLVVDLLYQTDLMRNQVIAAAEQSLDLAGHRVLTGPETWSWESPDLPVRIHVRPLGRHGSALADDCPAKGREWYEAIGARRRGVREFLLRIGQDTDDPSQGAIVEINRAEDFARRCDPKYAVRLGIADAGLVSQFLAVPDPDADDTEADAEFRAAAAWADALRQVGMRFVPDHSLGVVIPEGLNQLAFWLVKRRVDGPTGKAQFTPIAILIRPGQGSIMGRSPQTNGWVPYPDLLRALTGQLKGDQLATEEQQTGVVAAFVKQVLNERRAEPTLVLTHAQNTRSRWPWLKNDEIIADRIGFGLKGLKQRPSLYGDQLRVVRIAATDRYETAQWWAPNGQVAGISKGLWIPSGDDPRVFYSTTDKYSTNSLPMTATKLTTTGSGDIRPDKNASTPSLLQLTMAVVRADDDPETWAMFVHQQRFSDDYRDGLKLPLVMHLARLASDYALPHEELEDFDAADGDISDEAEVIDETEDGEVDDGSEEPEVL